MAGLTSTRITHGTFEDGSTFTRSVDSGRPWVGRTGFIPELEESSVANPEGGKAPSYINSIVKVTRREADKHNAFAPSADAVSYDSRTCVRSAGVSRKHDLADWHVARLLGPQSDMLPTSHDSQGQVKEWRINACSDLANHIPCDIEHCALLHDLEDVLPGLPFA